ncbi:hypothetical protein EIN_081800 [Entamoeba invadens IP1]|uniref:hypothetical protein n=1 Tax=Entamoeba invadens IP1 TaxID=370355 RepID=UPI0002C3F03A|nr:hypothetical protein EIN_081800 [Entamoeba invadens IP1]ELP85148.1 hypothetical protein EIN_081800 [Entamoeba invadens IP1]|eukprot:XP_004184494.1 hypothetical protein EIN_081800 [Entamoeba invadens IP1]
MERRRYGRRFDRKERETTRDGELPPRMDKADKPVAKVDGFQVKVMNLSPTMTSEDLQKLCEHWQLTVISSKLLSAPDLTKTALITLKDDEEKIKQVIESSKEVEFDGRLLSISIVPKKVHNVQERRKMHKNTNKSPLDSYKNRIVNQVMREVASRERYLERRILGRSGLKRFVNKEATRTNTKKVGGRKPRLPFETRLKQMDSDLTKYMGSD